jgi:hypothetical protein
MSGNAEFQSFTENEVTAGSFGLVVFLSADAIEWLNLAEPYTDTSTQVGIPQPIGFKKEPGYGIDAALFVGLPALGAFVLGAATSKLRHALHNRRQLHDHTANRRAKEEEAMLESWYAQQSYSVDH